MIKKSGFIVFLIVFIVALNLGVSKAQLGIIYKNEYENKRVGIRVTKPDSWSFIGLDEVIEKEKDKFEDMSKKFPGFKEDTYSLKTTTGMEPLTIGKYSEPHDGFNPTFQIVVHKFDPGDKESPEEILDSYMEIFSETENDWKTLVPYSKMEIPGIIGAYSKGQYSGFDKNDKSILVIGELWVIVKKDRYFLFLSDSEKNEFMENKIIFTQILDSIEFIK